MSHLNMNIEVKRLGGQKLYPDLSGMDKVNNSDPSSMKFQDKSSVIEMNSIKGAKNDVESDNESVSEVNELRSLLNEKFRFVQKIRRCKACAKRRKNCNGKWSLRTFQSMERLNELGTIISQNFSQMNIGIVSFEIH